MLSPIITTSGKGNRACQAASCSPASYCGRSPVPLSPMTANFSVSGLLGSGTCARDGAPACAAPTATDMSEGAAPAQHTAALRHSRNVVARSRRLIAVAALALSLEGQGHPVRNDVRVRIEEDHVLPDETVLELLGELGQVREHLRRDGGDGNLVGIAPV